MWTPPDNCLVDSFHGDDPVHAIAAIKVRDASLATRLDALKDLEVPMCNVQET